MNLEQFNFKPSLTMGVSEDATESIGKNCYVKLEKTHTKNQVRVIKCMYNEVVYNVLFVDNTKLISCLKSIGKKGKK